MNLNINFNAICPGFFPSKMPQALLGQIGDATPLGRLGGDEDLMGTVVFLALVALRYITGQYVAMCGGARIT